MNLETLQKRALELRKELEEIETAMRVISRYSPQPVATARVGPPPPSRKPPLPTVNTSIASQVYANSKDAIVAVLLANPKGLTKDQILEQLKLRGKEITPNTLIWSLSTHKQHFKTNGTGVWTVAAGFSEGG